MKRKTIIITFCTLTAVLILFISLLVVRAAKEKYPEVQRPEGIPDTVKWNPDLGEYYNSDSFEWDTEIWGYRPKEMNKRIVIPDSHMLGTYLSEDEYIEANSGTTDEVDKAVIKYYKKSREIVYPAVSYNYDPKEDPAFSELIANLKIKDFPNMISKIENRHIASGRLMHAINEMAGAKDLGKYVSGASENWLLHLKEKFALAESKVTKAAQKYKKSSNDEIKKQVKDELESCGLLVLPYIKDEIEAGNTAMIELLPNLVDKYFAEGKDNQADRTKEYWDNWFEKHSEDIKALKAVAEDLK